MERTVESDVNKGYNEGSINESDGVPRGGSHHRSHRPMGAEEQLPSYDPIQMRNETNTTTAIGALLHLIKSSLGSGILAMPYAFKNGGLIFGLLGTAAVGLLCTHSIYMLVVCSQTIARRTRNPALGFADTAYEAFKNGPRRFRAWAPFARNFVNGALFCTYYFGNCVYVILMSASIKQVVDAHLSPEWHMSIRWWILSIALPLLPLGIIRTLRLLVPFSAIATSCILMGLGCTMTWVIIGVSPFASQEAIAAAVPLPDIGSLPWIAPVSHMPIFFTTVIFSMEGIGIVLPVENSMRNPERFLRARPCGVLNAAMIFIVILYSTVGFFGYMRFGDTVEGSITLNLPNNLFTDAVKIMVMLSIVFSYGLQFCVPSEIAWTHVEPWLRRRKWITKRFTGNQKSSTVDMTVVAGSTMTTTTTTTIDISLTSINATNEDKLSKIIKEEESAQSINQVYYYIMRSVMILITFLIAAIVPQLKPIISLFGAVFFSVLGLFCPAIIHLATFWEDSDETSTVTSAQNRTKVKNMNESTECTEKQMSWLIVFKDAFIICLAMVALISGTFTSVIDIIAFYKLDGE